MVQIFLFFSDFVVVRTSIKCCCYSSKVHGSWQCSFPLGASTFSSASPLKEKLVVLRFLSLDRLKKAEIVSKSYNGLLEFVIAIRNSGNCRCSMNLFTRSTFYSLTLIRKITDCDFAGIIPPVIASIRDIWLRVPGSICDHL